MRLWRPTAELALDGEERRQGLCLPVGGETDDPLLPLHEVEQPKPECPARTEVPTAFRKVLSVTPAAAKTSLFVGSFLSGNLVPRDPVFHGFPSEE